MEREVFRSKPLRGLPNGLISGFMYGCIILLIALAVGVDSDMFIPLLVCAVILGGIIGIIRGIGKRVAADAEGIYLKNKEYHFGENDMYMQVCTYYYLIIPVTDRVIKIIGNNGKKHEVKCSYLSRNDAGRLAKIVESGMREKYRTEYDNLGQNNMAVKHFSIPAANLVEVIDKRIRLLVNLSFWTVTVLFSWVLISMVMQDQLEEYGIWLLLSMGLYMFIIGGTIFFISIKFRKSTKKIPREIVLCGDMMYIDGNAFGGVRTSRVVMTPESGMGTGDMRKLVIYEANGNTREYNFGFRGDRKTYQMYDQLVEAIKENFGDKFAYDTY